MCESSSLEDKEVWASKNGFDDPSSFVLINTSSKSWVFGGDVDLMGSWEDCNSSIFEVYPEGYSGNKRFGWFGVKRNSSSQIRGPSSFSFIWDSFSIML